MDSLQKAKEIVKILDSKIGEKIEVIELADLTVLTDYFVIATGTSSTHVKALADEVEFMMKQKGETPLHIESNNSNNWILLDYGTVIVHVFMEDTREFYNLERLWKDGKSIDISDIIE